MAEHSLHDHEAVGSNTTADWEQKLDELRNRGVKTSIAIVPDCQMLPRRPVHLARTSAQHQGHPDERPLGRGQLGPAKQEPRVRRALQDPLEKGGRQVRDSSEV